MLDPTQPFLSLPAHVIDCLAVLRQRVRISTFFEGNCPVFEAASRKYAKGFGIKTSEASRPSFAFTTVSR